MLSERAELKINYKHIEINYAQNSKKPDAPPGDIVIYEKTPVSTIVIVSDGLGSGIKANISANMTAARLIELIKRGFSVFDAAKSVVATMHKARQEDLPYAVFTIINILNDGVASILSYEMPPPVFIVNKYAAPLRERSFTLGGDIVNEYECYLDENNVLAVVSDGITQAGMGITNNYGWTIEGYCAYINKRLRAGDDYETIMNSSLIEAKKACGGRFGDDTTAAFISCRKGNIINIFTGPPADEKNDYTVVKKFLDLEGIKVVCGSSTAGIVARHLSQKLNVENKTISNIEPPKYEIEGIDLVTEGAITLNQVYNIIDEDTQNFTANTGVCTLHSLFSFADRVNFIIGRMKNEAHKDPVFLQLGVLSRTVIVPLIAEKLRKKGKMVSLEYV